VSGVIVRYMDVRRQIPRMLLAAALLLGLAAAPAQARYSSKKAIWGPAYVDGVSQFPRYRYLGVGIFEASLHWDTIAPTRPANPRNPRDPAYQWPEDVDRAVAEAGRYRMRVALMLIGAPSWANGGRSWNGAPHERDFADFAYAASRHYRGAHLWMVWGEPSRATNFQPLTPAPAGARLTAAQASAPRRYARLLDAAYGSLKRASSKNRVIGGMTYSTGDISAWQWIKYMRLPTGKPPRFDIYGHNPFTWRYPDLHAPQSCCGLSDYGDLLRFGRAVDRNFRRKGRGPIPLFLSEFFIPTAPDSELNVWVDPPVQASWIRAALKGVRASSRIAAFGWIHLYDDPPSPTGARVSHSGLLYADGTPKPGYSAFSAG
jgi:hypothetical protein